MFSALNTGTTPSFFKKKGCLDSCIAWDDDAVSVMLVD
jgi:hypothetical protein